MKLVCRTVVAAGCVLAAAVSLMGSVAVAAAPPAGQPDVVEHWVQRLVEADASGNDWRVAFGLGERVAELEPPERGVEVMRRAWPKLEQVEFKQQLVKAWHFSMPYPLAMRVHPRTMEFFSIVLDAGEDDVSRWVVSCLPSYAWAPIEDVEQSRAFLRRVGDADALDVIEASMVSWAGKWNEADEAGRVELADQLHEIRVWFRRVPELAQRAENAGIGPILEAIVTSERYSKLARNTAFGSLQNLRPGFRDEAGWAALEAEIEADGEAELAERMERARAQQEREAAARIARLNETARLVDGHPQKRWLLHAPLASESPEAGYALLLVMPGGPGTIDFAPFVESVLRERAGRDVVVAQLVAPDLSNTPDDDVVWPRRQLPDERVDFTIEPVAMAVIDAVKKEYAIDPSRVYTMGWSSGGPPAYALALDKGSPVRGAVVLMSVFRPDSLPALEGAKGKAFAVIHSPDDFIAMRFPESAVERLAEHGARTRLWTYEGGHGWQGDAIDLFAEGVRFLDERE